MQAMLMAFITTNMNNSGIPSTKANPISRTFPPLFMIKISEEEKIVEDLHKIESMQLIVQITMIIVCILIAFIVMYYCGTKFRYCYIVGLGLNCKFIDLLFKRSVIKFIKISSHLDFIVSEIICNQTDTFIQRLMDLR